MIFDDLPGDFSIALSREHSSFRLRSPELVAVLVEQTFDGKRVSSGWVPVNETLLADAHRGLFEAVVEAHLEHIFRPWAFPDSETACPWPTLIPFPKIHLLERLARSGRARRNAWLDARFLAARRVRKLADLVEGDQDLPPRRRGPR